MADKSNQPLFADFPPVSTQEWMDKITADLKGADFEKKLVWKTNEGFSVQPFYREEDLDKFSYLSSLPGEFPYVRGTKNTNKWLIRQDIVVKDAKTANEKALNLLTKGVNSLGFIFEDENLISKESVAQLLNNLVSNEVEINFSTRHGNKKLLQLVVAEFRSQNRELGMVSGSINFDPVGQLTISGKSCETIEKTMVHVAEVVNEAKDFPAFQTISVNGRYFGNAGSTILQELAFALSMGNEYLSQLTDRGININDAAKAIRFNLSVGSNYFMEIAKLRAARLLWSTIVKEYKPSGNDVCKMVVHSETSEFNKTVYDPYVNMLRTQTEAMSASIGGCHSLTVQPFDKIFRTPGEISERIARNQQLLLKEESYFSMITDPSAGSYYIEALTDSIAKEAWKLFLEVEAKGGYLAALKDGFIQNQIEEAADLQRKTLAQRRSVMVGTNQYPNTSEKVAEAIDAAVFNKNTAEGDEIKPINLFRNAEEFESLRFATEQAAKRPKVFMLTYGNLAMRLARSQFSGNFFGCAGYEIIDNLGFSTVEDGVEAALKANADIVVLCSSDDEYIDAAPLAFEKLGGKAQFVVAGAPACMDDLKAIGIEHFINVRSNVLETLKEFNKLLNI
ncbi:methylmalonyl-CoA mutase family protein [Alkalitalea saponilacus]|uniref:Methylmalonyl-CoA mutase n=1 Tax=Alkalitalea saponilacus TaxID=889453 RepID=A0A1T5AKQ5_9BACT|nr:methylmalonyl-CoA mutase family protein [Alkalitalea saponilacus]ASB48666.1 methylmalonyl-CoA mutase small subunit [Alkalitalea saponilacus]SKB35611.1 methylmalonyl-CoA mutase [Alkalitalea saponilacus]